jgi:hypothetical protein
MVYQTNPVSADQYPNAADTGHWGNGGVGECVYTAGGFDFAAGGDIRWVILRVIGPGTMTMRTAAAVGPCANGAEIAANAFVSGGGSDAVATATGVPGDTLSVTIPDDGECGHYIILGSVPGGEFGFGGCTWSPSPLGSPTTGQLVHEPCFAGDGTTTVYTSAYAYLPSSIRLLVDGLDWLSDLTETDPVAGTVTTDYAPPLDSTVCFRYRAA